MQDWQFKLPFICHFPEIAALDEETIVVVNSRGPDNAWVVRAPGLVVGHFPVGDGVEQVLATDAGIVVTYFDEGVFGNDLGAEGVGLFSTEGAFLGGYRTRLGSSGVGIYDCYCACIDTQGRLLFFAYAAVPNTLVRLDLGTWQQETWQLPAALHNPWSIAAANEKVFFWRMYGGEGREILAFDIPTGAVTADGTLDWDPSDPRPVGYPGGKFVVARQHSYDIVELSE
jgi:hypothetical protein